HAQSARDRFLIYWLEANLSTATTHIAGRTRPSGTLDLNSGAGSLLLDVFLQVFGPDLGAVYDTLRIRGNTFRCASSGKIGVRIWVRDEVLDRSILGASDSYASLPAGMVFRVRICVGDIDVVLLVDVNPARPAELLRLPDKGALLVEDLNSSALAVSDEHPPLGINRDGVQATELARASPFLSPRLDELPILGKLHDTLVAGRAMPVCDENVAIRSDRKCAFLIERVRAIACNSGLAERHQDFSVRAKLEHLHSFTIFRLKIGD